MRRFAALALVLVAGCNWGPEYKLPPPSTSRLPSASDAPNYARLNDVAFQLAEAMELGSGGNEVVSPLSVSHNLALVLNGSSTSAHDELMRLFDVTEEDRKAFNESQRALLNRLDELDGRPLRVGAALFTVWPLPLDPGYISRMGAIYGATAENLGGSGIEAKRLVDQWVRESTDGAITEVVDDIDKSEELLLVNVAYFTAKWERPFDPIRSYRGEFAGSAREASFMSQSGEAECYAGDAFKAVRLPYRGGEFAFIAMLPGEGRDAGGLLNKNLWSELNEGFVKQDANIVLPKFAFGAEHDLKPAIEQLGVPSLFNESCNLRPMSIELESGYRFSRMVHKALVRVDEEGTTAASVTISAVEGGEKGEGAFEFVADRPFAFAIVDVKTGVICFLGVVSAP